MKVNVYPADEGGCGFYRMRWPAAALAAQGHEVEIRSGLPAVWMDDEQGKPHLMGCEPIDADVVVIQRPLLRHLADIIPHIQEQGVAVVVEIDDDFAAIPPANVSWARVHPKHNPERNSDHLARGCASADLVTVTTPALAKRYGGHGRVRVVPNFVPERYLAIEPTPSHSIGWTGSVTTHPGDLEVTHGAVQRVIDATGATMRVVGTGKGVAKRLGLEVNPAACGWAEIDDYPERMAEVGVGIVPLADSAFNNAKSCLKMMEFAAVGVPVVASPSPDNLRLHQHGIGMIARRPREWERALRTLLGSDDLRAEMAAHGRKVMAGLTIEANAFKWWSAWSDAAHLSRQRSAA